MTTFDTAAAWQNTKPLARRIVAALLAFGLAGCETANIAGRWQQRRPAGDACPRLRAAAAAVQTAKVWPSFRHRTRHRTAGERRRVICRTQLASPLERKGIRVSPGPGGRRSTRCAATSSRAREKTESKVSYIWDVTDQTGKRVHRVTGEEFAPARARIPGRPSRRKSCRPSPTRRPRRSRAGCLAAQASRSPATPTPPR